MAKDIIHISGVSESRSVPVIARTIGETKQSLIITSSQARAERLAYDLSFFSEQEILVLPGEEQVFLKFEARNREGSMTRLAALKALRTGAPVVVIAPASAAVKRLMPMAQFEQQKVHVALGAELEPAQAASALAEMGYERMDIVDGKGQFSVRGGILDVFLPDGEDPVRIELFGTEVDSIRTFDVDTQRSIENQKELWIYPADELLTDQALFAQAAEQIQNCYDTQIRKLLRKGDEAAKEAAQRLDERKRQLCEYIDTGTNLQLLENYIYYFYDKPTYLWDYLDQGTIVVDDPTRICEHLELRQTEITADLQVLLQRGEAVPEDGALITGKLDFFQVYEQPRVYAITPFLTRVEGIDGERDLISIESRQMMAFHGKMDLVESEVHRLLTEGYQITFAISSQERLESLLEFAQRCGFDRQVTFREGTLSAGMVFPEEKVCYISDADIFSGQKYSRRRRKKSRGRQMQSFADMKAGDYVVHENHGIGKFLGIASLTVQGETKDYLKIKYAGDDMLYVPVEQMDVVQKYIGGDGAAPKVSKLSGAEWKTAKAKAKASIAEMTQELIDLYARRQVAKGYAFGEDTIWQKDFEEAFPYEETADQLRSIEEIKKDMEKPEAMDRLLCGDVGFGKTEVAARAMFKCVAEGRQAAVLVPTTILADQHYRTLKDRFEAFPFQVEMLSRFRSASQQDEIIRKLGRGEIDLVIGTHRLLSSDIQFRDLGLLVIDEEQRFGVAHKEKIKQLKENVDVLTLSATPIPRTLNMSLTGIKDMSLIEEPPEERYPVQTYVLEQEDHILREVIGRELDRDGQVFVIYNRVKGIQRIADQIRQLVPDARIAVGHGQMPEQALEDVMASFINGESNVLISTTIVESGIDIPNANTLVVLDADRFGLSQLYQLRGRVGRSTRIAYAYLMYQGRKILTEVSEKRLKAIREFTEFGSGFKIAMRDLELRGAGNLLGSEQSGHMMNIGYELYCKLVDEAVRTARGEAPTEKPEEVTVELKAEASIPAWYISNEVLKLQMYKKIASIETQEDMEEIVDEMLDRFGDLPRETYNLVKISRIRSLACLLATSRVYEQNGKIMVQFGKDNMLNGYAMMHVMNRFGHAAFVHAGVEPYIRLTCDTKHKLDDCMELLALLYDNRKMPEEGEGTHGK